MSVRLLQSEEAAGRSLDALVDGGGFRLDAVH